MDEFAIQAEALVKDFPGIRALDGLTFRVPRGAVYGFLGRNGAGKSTTIKTLLGLVRPTAGRARVFGADCGPDQVGILARTAFVSERKLLYDDLTPRQMVRFNRAFFPRWSDAAAEKYARWFDIPMDRRIGKLSHGNRTKVSLLLALAQNADLLILDEPTEGLDAVFRDEVLKALLEDHVSDGRTVFFSSHDLEEVEQIAEWVGIIDNGRLLLEAPLDEVRSTYRFVTAAGNNLPRAGEDVAHCTRQESFSRYLLARNAEGFAAALRAQGATVLDVVPASLRELFLALVRKEESCTAGSSGMTTVTTS